MTSPNLRVAVNLLWCVPGRVGGSEEYLVRQLAGLGEVAPRIDVTIFAHDAFGDAHPSLCASVECVLRRGSGDSRVGRVATEHTWLARHTRGVDVVHHGGGTMPAFGANPTVLTIHDLQYVTHPDYHSAVKLRYLQTAVPRSARRATVITTPTEWVRSTVIEHLGVEPRRVRVVPHGVDAALGTAAVPESTLRRRYALGDGPIVVFPAITHPHKGHEFLLDVVAASWTDPTLRLVLLGGAGRADAAVAAAIERHRLGDRVIRPGRVPDADRDGLIAMAAAVAFPSEYEGFGAPVVEAMMLGTPVIASDQPAVSEVVGDAGLVLPRSLDAWADALDQVAARRAELVRRGHDRASRFTAQRSGAALADAYRAAVDMETER